MGLWTIPRGLVATATVSFFFLSIPSRSFLRMSAALFFVAFDRRVKDSEYCRTEQERSSNYEQVLILLLVRLRLESAAKR